MSLSGSGFGDGSPTRLDGGFDSSLGSLVCPLSCMIIEGKTADEAAAFLELMSDTAPAKRGSGAKICSHKQILTAAFQFARFAVISRSVNSRSAG